MKIYRNKKPSTPVADTTPTRAVEPSSPEPASSDAQPIAAEPISPEAAPSAAKTGKAAKAKSQSESTQGDMVSIIKSAQAPKLSPRGDGQLTYQVGRIGEIIYVRISHNAATGRFSREFVNVGAIRSAIASLPKEQPLFKPAIGLKSAWSGKSSCNSGFAAAILKAEGVLVTDPEKKGMMRLATPDALDTWEQAMLAIKVPKGAEQVPLHPPKVVPDFGKRAKTHGTAGAAATDGATGDQSVENTPREDEAPQPVAGETAAGSQGTAENIATTDTATESGDGV